MDISVTVKNPGGTVKAITSKSHAHRHLICSALSDVPNFVEVTDTSSDIDATVQCLNSLGANITAEKNGFYINPIKTVRINALLDCNESASTFRFLLPVTCALGAKSSFIMKKGLSKRPITPLYNQLIGKGCTLSLEGTVPFLTEGQLKSGIYQLPGDVSSQYISGLLLALPLLKNKSGILLTSDLQSSGYVDMTADVMNQYNVKIIKTEKGFEIPGNATYTPTGNMSIEKDWSNAAFFLCAGAFSERGITVTGLNIHSRQTDKTIIDILKTTGAYVTVNKDSVTVKKNRLNATDIDASQIPDLVPVLALLAAVAEGTTNIFNAKRLQLKESNRLSSTYDMLKTLGADITEKPDSLVITGKEMLNGGTVCSHNDHRIAMTAAIASVVCENAVIIKEAHAVNKSYPAFFRDFASIGGITERI